MMKTKVAANVDEYLAALPLPQRALLNNIRKTIKAAAPAAEETISYQMPAYKYHGMLVYFAAFKNHCSLFPGGVSRLLATEPRLRAFATSKGTLQFTPEQPIPLTLVTKVVKMRVRENEEKWRVKQALKNNDAKQRTR